MMAFGQEIKNERYCGKCVSEGKHKLIYILSGTIIRKEIKPKIIGGRCECCMKGKLVDVKV